MSDRIFFNVAGPCVPGKHYMLDPLRGGGDELMKLIDGEQYFIIHAARQTGKTTLLKELVRRINAAGKYYALYCSLEAIQTFTDPTNGVPEIVKTVAGYVEEQGLPEGFALDADYSHISGVLKTSLVNYCRSLDKPLVIFFDEADSLSDDTLITFLMQLRSGYNDRPDPPFVHSVALVGLRNLRDYKAKVRFGSEKLKGPSPFNIITESLNLRNFTCAEVAKLYAQHTAETGQIFETDAIDHVFEQTQGQPWLVNAVARHCVEKITKEDYTVPITEDMAARAIQHIITARETHVDSMMDKLRYPEVSRVIVPLITGGAAPPKSSDEYQFTKDLGLIRDDRGRTEPANPIYAELIVRTLSFDLQDVIKESHPEYTLPRYLKDDGTIDMNFLIKEFQIYWRENSMIWKELYSKDFTEYQEAAAEFVMFGFMQRVVNGGARIIRQMAANTKRADMCVVYNGQKYPIELKVLQTEKSREDSYNQLLNYMDAFGADTGWLIIFDKSENKTWDEKIYMKEEIIDGKKIVTAGC